MWKYISRRNLIINLIKILVGIGIIVILLKTEKPEKPEKPKHYTNNVITANQNYNLNYNNRVQLDTKAHIDRNVLTKHKCDELVSLSKQISFEEYIEPVDGRPVFQLDIITDGNKIHYPKLWAKVEPIYETHVKTTLHNTNWIHNPKLDFVFLKRYLPNERKYLGLHTDSNFFTVTYLLSDTSNFEGGEFYMYSKQQTKQLEKKIDTYSPEERDKFVQNEHKLSHLPIINYELGDQMVFSGEEHYHGILPVDAGERYVLIFFFDNSYSNHFFTFFPKKTFLFSFFFRFFRFFRFMNSLA